MADCTDEIIDLVKGAIENKNSLAIQGGGTKSFMGRSVPLSNHIVDTTGHSGIITYEPIELVMQARAGTTIEDIEKTLTEHGQCLPSEPGDFDGKSTIGGSLAANVSGPSRPFAGSLRDHILGVSLINGRAEHLKFGGQVMKNVAGYDVSRLQAGSMGTLGVMTDISFKVMPKLKYEATYVHNCSAEEALSITNETAGSEKPITAASWVSGQLYLRFATNESALGKSIGKIPGSPLGKNKSGSHWSSFRNFSHSFFTPAENEEILRISIKSGAPHASHIEGEWLFDWAGSLRYLKTNRENLNFSEIEEWSSRYNAEFIFWRGGGKTSEILTNLDENLRQIQLNLKKAFDPHGIFNPGRLYEWM